MINSVQINENASEALKGCIRDFNQSLCRDRQIEIVHKVYDLGFDEIAEALGASIFSQTVNLKLLLGEYEVTYEVNVVKPTTKRRVISFLLAPFRLILNKVKQ